MKSRWLQLAVAGAFVWSMGCSDSVPSTGDFNLPDANGSGGGTKDDLGGNTGGNTGGATGEQTGGHVTGAIAISQLSTTLGPTTGGTVVELTGAGFNATTRVTFGDTAAQQIHVVSTLRMAVVTPAAAEGFVTVSVANDDGGTAELPNGFNFYDPATAKDPAPALLKVAPNSGPAEGGTVAVVQGGGFLPGARFFVGWRQVKYAEVASVGYASVITPPMTEGSVDIAVTNPDGQSAILPAGFNAYGAGRELTPGPQLNSVFPASSPVTGGTLITLKGSHLNTSSQLILGGMPMSTWAVLSESEGTFETPAHTAGLVSIAVTNPDGQSAMRPDAILFYIEPPVIHSVEPPAGPVPGGNTVTLHGSHFLEGMTITIGGKPCTGLILVAGDGAASESNTGTCVVPAGDAAGPVDVVVQNPDGLSGSLPGGYTYLSPNPTITEVIPSAGPTEGGFVAAVRGSDFQPTSVVHFGDNEATLISWAHDSLTVTVPAGAAGEVDVTVTAEGYPTASLAKAFLYTELGPPAVAGVTPGTGPVDGGIVVVISGENFRPQSTVWFGGTPALEVMANAPEAITVVLPAAATEGLVDITVKTPGFDDATLKNGFLYVAPETPAISQINPKSGPMDGGMVVSIQGSGFKADSQVFFGAVPATDVLSNGPTGITVMLPAASAGTVDVVVKTPGFADAILNNGFTYEAPGAPKITGVIPDTGPIAGGGLVLVQGEHFAAGSTVSFGALTATTVHIVGPKGIVVELPAGSEGPVDIRVQAPGASDALAPNAFTYIAPDSPAISSVIPNVGPVEGGIVVLIEGQDFRPDSEVWFGAVKAATELTHGPNGIGVELPPGVAGPIDVTLKTPGFDDTSLADGFTYQELGPPVLSSVVPAKGSTEGGQIVLVKGQNLRPQTTLWFGTNPATQVVANGPDGIAVALPAATAGTVDITAKTVGFADSVLDQAFTYEVPPPPPEQAMAIAQIQPATGPASGGGWVIVKGLNLPNTPLVQFGDNNAMAFHFINKTTLTAKVPAGAAGPVTVKITDLTSGQKASLPAGYVYYADGEATAPKPVLDTLKPAIGPAMGGTLALLSGQAIQTGAYVFVDGRPANQVVVTGDSFASFRTPLGDPGVVDVTLVNPDGGHDTLAGSFVYTTASTPSIALTAVVPVQGTAAGGADVTVTGSGFLPGTLIFMDGQPVQSQIINGKNVGLVTPKHAPGLVSVQATAPDGFTATLDDAYNFILEAPFIAGITPDFGKPAGGSVVVISGQGFHKNASVKIGTSDCPVVAATDTLITCTTGQGALGPADVTVQNPDFLSNTLVDGFLYSDVVPGDAVQIHGVAPNTGPSAGGSVSTITGIGFGPNTSVIVGLEVAPSVVILSDTALLVTMPAGPVGAKNVQVIVPEVGSGNLKNGFFHYDEDSASPWPNPSGIVPSVGPITGGTVAQIDVISANIDSQVFFGGEPAQVLGWDGHGHLTVRTPPLEAGLVDVTVMNPDGKAATLGGAFTYYTPGPDVIPPVLTQVEPTGGSTVGGEPVSLTGAAFEPGMIGFLGYHPIAGLAVSTANAASGASPAHVAGLVDATVTRLDGFTATLKGAFGYTAPAPAVASIFPEVGHTDGGATVVVVGTAFQPGAQVFFGDTQAPSATVVAPHLIMATTPAMAAAGVVDVLVINPDGKQGALAQAYTYNDGQFADPAPTVLTLLPDHGPYQGGTVAAVYGTGFQPGAKVLFGGKPAQVNLIDSELITVTTPDGFVGPVDVTVLNPDGQGGSLAAGFSYIVTTAPKPVLYGITPPSGPETGGTSVILTGSQITPFGIGFVGYRPLSSWTVLNSAIATGTTVGGGPGQHDVVVTNGDGQSATLADAFNYVGAPQIDSFQPVIGAVAGGTVVNIAGKNFDAQAKVSFGGKPAASIAVLSAFVIKAQTPTSDPGPAQVRVENPDGQWVVAQTPFTFVLPPVLNSVYPAKGSAEGGTPIILTGAELLEGAQVSFGDSPATGVVVVDANTVTAFAPAGPTGEKVTITLKNPDGQSALLPAAFEYVDPASIGPAPAALSLQPTSGPTTGGTWGMVTGENLQAGAWAIIGTIPVNDFQVYGGASARFVTGASAIAVTMGITIINPDGGFGTLADAFTYVDPADLNAEPDVTGLTPVSGPTKGGTVVALTGTELSADTLVFFDQTPQAAIAAGASPTEILSTTPAHDLGAVDVTVTDSEGQTIALADAFEYVAPPTILTVTPDKGPSGGGTGVTLTGLNFRVGSTAETSATVLVCEEWDTQLNCTTGDAINVVDSGQIQFVTPAGIAGLADIVVKNPDGQVAVAAQVFLYTPPPEVQGVVPASGTTLGGDTIALHGTGFQPGATVMIGGTPATDVVVESGGKIICKTPAGAPGPAAVTVTNPDLTSHTVGGGFLYVRPPEIINIFPTLGPEPGGTVVTIQGKGFVAGPIPAERSRVYFGGVEVPDVDIKVESDTLITCKTPGGVGPVAVKIINPDDQFDVIAGGFIYIPVIPPPEVKSLQPSFGGTAGGYLVNVIGNSFLQGAQVSFGNDQVGWVNGTQVKVKNAGTLIVVTAPAHPAGKVSVKVTNSDGQFGILVDGFEYAGPLSLPGLAFMGISPDRGPSAGGYDVVVYGQGFETGLKVYWGHEATGDWTESTTVIRLGPTLLRVTMPTWATSEKVDIRIVNPAFGGIADEIVGSLAFTYGQSVVLEPKGLRLPIDQIRGDRAAVVFDANGDGFDDVMNLHGGPQDELYLNTLDENGKPGQFIDVTAQAMPSKITNSWWREYPTVADLDQDGDLDVVVKFYRYVGVYRNQGDGTFTFDYYNFGVNIQSATDMDLGDLDCDGVPDLFVTTTAQNYVFSGDATGKFVYRPGVIPNHSEPSRSTALGDVDNDGDLDILVANDTAFQNRLYYNNCNNTALPPNCSFEISGCKTATFKGHRYQFCPQSKNYWDAKNICQTHGYQLLTLNNDEERDFVKTQITYYTWIGLFDDNKDKTYEWVYEPSNTYSDWQSGQPNDGGNSQCVIMNYISYQSRWDDQSCGSGYHYACEVSAISQCPAPWSFTDATYGTNKNFPVSGFNSKTAILKDIDGDTWLDAVIINSGQTNRIYFNNGGSFANDTGLYYPQDESADDTDGRLLDVDLDGDLDLMVMRKVNSSSRWPALYLNDKAQGGSGVFTDATPVNLPGWRGEDSVGLAVGDLNSDGLDDLYIVNQNHQDWMFINHGFQENKPELDQNRVPIGAFANNTFSGLPEAWATHRRIAVGDVDGDGDLDIVIATGDGGNYDQTTRLWLNDGVGNFFDHSEQLADDTCNGYDVRLADINNDGDLDIILICYEWNGSRGGLRMLVNDGQGTFKNVSSPNFPGGLPNGGRNHGLGLGDIDEDGDLDLFYGGYSSTWGVLVNGGDVFNNDGAFFLSMTSTILPSVGNKSESRVIVTDLNADQHLDVYVVTDGQQNGLYYNNGDVQGTMKSVSGTHLPAVSDASRWAVASDVDFDGDGRLDVFLCGSGVNRIYLNKTPAP